MTLHCALVFRRCGGGLIGLALLLLRTAAASAAGTDDDRTAAPYFLVQSDDPAVDRFPLLSTSADVKVAGVIADVTVTQVYTNEGRRPLEASYVFPASTRAALYAMKMTIDDRVIVARIQERKAARAGYENARAQGKAAALLEQQRPNVLQMNVANILPGDRVTVELRYTELLVPADGQYELVYPTVVGPRYVGGRSRGILGWLKTPFTAAGIAPSYDLHLHARLDSGLPLHDIMSPSHEIEVRYDGLESADVELGAAEAGGGNRDFVLRYRLAGNRIESGLLLGPGAAGEDGHFLLMVQPPRRVQPADIPPREYIFIVDVSGSMSGFPLSVSKALLRDLIVNLRPIDRFNILFFAGGNWALADEPLAATPDNVAVALTQLEGQSGGGGTELMPALRRALAMPRAEGTSRTVVVATDGYVTVEPEAFDLIRRSLGEANLFAFGIGSAVNRFLIEGMARAGLGEPFVVMKAEDASAAAQRFRRYVESPVLTGVRVESDGWEMADVEPPAIPDVLAQRPVVVFGKWRGRAQGRVTVTGMAGDGVFKKTFDVGRARTVDSAALRYLWARHRITRLSDDNMLVMDKAREEAVTQLGLRYNLLTAYTSFLAVDSVVRNTAEAPVAVTQPLPLPQGVPNSAVGGSTTGPGAGGCGVCETVTVMGARQAVNVEQSCALATIEASQLEALPLKGRDVMNLLRLAPGVRYEDDIDALADRVGSPVPHVGGQRQNWNSVTVDGMTANDLAGTSRVAAAVSLSAIAEVNLLPSAYKAEYGGTGGANIQITSKGGTNEYRGSLYWNGRRSAWNAAPWESNRASLGRAPSGLDAFGFDLGGPVPGLRDRLFLHGAFERQGGRRAEPLLFLLLPTAAERAGDFSQTLHQGAPSRMTVLDPLTQRPFPGNVLPAARIDPAAQALLASLPRPDRLDRGETNGSYNFIAQPDSGQRRWNHLLRLDWNPSEKDRAFLVVRGFQSRPAASGTAGVRLDFADLDAFDDRSITASHTRLLSPAAAHETTLGARRQQTRFATGLPQASVGFETSGVAPVTWIGPARADDRGRDDLLSGRDTLTWIRGRHLWKTGLLVEHVRHDESRGDPDDVYREFASGGTTPFDTGNGYANLLLGLVQDYGTRDSYRRTQVRQWRAEYFAQDTWKITRRLTLDYGLRVLWYTPYRDADPRAARLVLERYDPARAPRLYRPAVIGGDLRAIDTLTGRELDRTYVGAFVPGTGDPANGLVAAGDPTYPSGFGENPGLHPEPRLGVAYDVFGQGRTVLRASVGLFHQGYLAPDVDGDTLSSAALGARPTVRHARERDAATPSTYAWALGVEHEAFWRTIVGIGYVGTLNRHLEMERDHNRVPDGARFDSALPDDFLRPYPGHGPIQVRENWGTANHNALHLHAYRRGRRLRLDASYTFAKSLGLGDEDPAIVDVNRPIERYYAPLGHSRAHTLVLAAAYDVPKASALVDSAPVRWLFDNWQLTAEMARASGDWAGITLSTTDHFDFTGGSVGAVPVMSKNPRTSGGSAFDAARPWFDTSAFARPSGRGDAGNTPRTVVVLPGIDNLNLSAAKSVPLGGRRRLQIRLEAYNALNHTQLRDVDRTARFDPDGRQVNAGFGLAVGSARPARVLQTSVRLTF
jgi:Ca-activated chloride channel family protein